ncbi:MAG: hypothetical protein R3C99_04505 [Pirellulaceae bacterium]
MLSNCCLRWQGRCLLLIGLWVLPLSALAERPAAPKLLPRSTMAYLRVHSAPELVEAFRETSGGRMARDEQIQPLLAHLYGSLTQAFADAQGELGMSLDELLSIPRGEMCVAFVAPEQGQPAVAVILEAGENLPIAERLLGFARDRAVADGATVRTESYRDTELKVFETGETTNPAYFIREATIVISSDVALTKQMLNVWDGEQAETLADNRRFTTIMSRSQGTKEERPQITWFVEPIDLVKRLTRGNLTAAAGLAILPALGVDGLQAIGGSMILATEEFDSIMHLHVMMQTPREGVLKMIALEPGDITPENWVPSDVASYTTLHWNGQQTFDALMPVYDAFRGEGAMLFDIDARINEPLGLDLQQDFLDQFDGRMTLVTWFEKPARLNSQSTMLAFKMKDGKTFSGTLDKLLAKVAPNAEKKSHRGATYYRFEPGGRRARERRERLEGNDLFRRPEPLVGILGDYVILTDSVRFFEEVVASSKNDSSLAGELDFKLIASKFKQHSQGEKPALVSFSRPEEGMRLLYELATSESTRGRLSSAAENNGFFRAIHEALEANELPPFAAIARYLAPTGALLINDETGLHYTAFGLKRE